MIRAYDEYGNIVNIVELEKYIRGKSIDDFEYVCVQMILVFDEANEK